MSNYLTQTYESFKLKKASRFKGKPVLCLCATDNLAKNNYTIIYLYFILLLAGFITNTFVPISLGESRKKKSNNNTDQQS